MDDCHNEEAHCRRKTPEAWQAVCTLTYNPPDPIRQSDKSCSAIPHPLESTSSATICLITADPQRNFKDVIEHPSFPADLRPRITRVVGLSKLKAKCKQYEERRKLYAEHDIFLADDRVVTLLPQVLGKTFYQGGAKRPIPVNIAPPRKRDENGKTEKKAAKKSDGEGSSAASPENVAKEITKALSSALVHLAPGVSTSIKVAKANFTPEQVAENINAVLQTLTEKLITKGWRNIRSINIKGPETASYPIWEASELWVDEEDVLEEKKKTYGGNKGPKAIKSARKALNASLAIEDAKAEEAAETKLKRKAEDVEKPSTEKHTKKKRKAEVVDEKLSADLASKKDRLKKQKAEALAAVGQDVV